MDKKQYDYIIAGAGASGLSLIMHLIRSGKFRDKNILLVDRNPKAENDRTWCFWENEPGLFENIVFKKWKRMWFHGSDGSSALHDISPYEYKMIRGIDFYNYCFDIIRQQPNISIKYGEVENIESTEAETSLSLDGKKFSSEYIFSSIRPGDDQLKAGNYFLWQHFKGWVVHSEREVFNSEEATLMDFRTGSFSDTRFVYVMPFTSQDALIEYTVFSEDKLSEKEYNQRLEDYICNILLLRKNEFVIQSEEFGMIPMTNFDFPSSHRNIIYIGSAGGKIKASTGYTFKFIQKHCERIVEQLMAGNEPGVVSEGKKFAFYDSVLLNILSEKKLPGETIFTKLFANNSMSEVMKFLDNETSLAEDIRLIRTLPKRRFLGAAFSHLLK